MERFVLSERFTESIGGHVLVFKKFDAESGPAYFVAVSSALGLQDLDTGLCFAGFALTSAYPIARGADQKQAVETLKEEMVKEEKCGRSQIMAYPELALNSAAAPLLRASGFYVYVIRHDSRWYVGQSQSLRARLRTHHEKFGGIGIHSLEWVATTEEANALEEIRTAALMTRLPPGAQASGGSWAVASATSPSKRAAVVAGLCTECGRRWSCQDEGCQNCAPSKRIRRSWASGTPIETAVVDEAPTEEEKTSGTGGGASEEAAEEDFKTRRLRKIARGAGSTTWDFGEWKTNPTAFRDMLNTTKGLQACVKVLFARSKGQYFYGLPALFANYLLASDEAAARLRHQAAWKACQGLPLEDPAQTRLAP